MVRCPSSILAEPIFKQVQRHMVVCGMENRLRGCLEREARRAMGVWEADWTGKREPLRRTFPQEVGLNPRWLAV